MAASSSPQLPPVRLIVTAIDKSGKSYIEYDGAPKNVRANPDRPGWAVTSLWATFGMPAPLEQPDRVGELKGIMPPPKGTFIKTIDYPPHSDQAAANAARSGFITLGTGHEPGVRRDTKARHPGMHETDTIDYAIVLFGEIYALVDEGEVLLKEGDVLVHRGTNHAWSNRADKPCRVLFVLVDAEPKRDK
jgi:hypothetical protein